MEYIQACRTREIPIYDVRPASAVFSLARLYISLILVSWVYHALQGASATLGQISYRNMRSTSTKGFTVTCINSLVIVRLRSTVLPTASISARYDKCCGSTFSDVLGCAFSPGKFSVHAPVVNSMADN